MDKKEKTEFIARAILWALFACIAPVSFVAWRYDIFKPSGSTQLTGWGLFCIILIAVFLITLVNYIKAGLVGWSMTKQIFNGVLKVIIPIGVVLVLCMEVREKLDYFIQALSCVLICETIAIPINPFPKWIWETTQGRFEGMIDFIAHRWNAAKEKEEK